MDVHPPELQGTQGNEYEHVEAAKASCVFCGASGGRPLSICGHQHCRGCVKGMITSGVTLTGVCCAKCGTRVSIRDVRAAIDTRTLDGAVADAARCVIAASPT